jgi:hypothetical protein
VPVATLAVATLAVATLAVATLAGIRQDGEDQSGRYQREHLDNTIVKSGIEHAIFIGITWPKLNNKHKTDLPVFTKTYGEMKSDRFETRTALHKHIR